MSTPPLVEPNEEIECPNCGKDVPMRASVCPHCDIALH
jgi:NMD protein affecting ribosome stability and mRNA decay